MSTINLDLPESLHHAVLDLAKKENMPLDQLITKTLAEKIAVIEEDAYMRKRIQRANETNFDLAMAKIAETEPADYDKLP